MSRRAQDPNAGLPPSREAEGYDFGICVLAGIFVVEDFVRRHAR